MNVPRPPLSAEAISSDIGVVLGQTAEACPLAATTPVPASPQPADYSPDPAGYSPAPYDPTASGDLGTYGAAALPAIEDARHFGFMSIIGRR